MSNQSVLWQQISGILIKKDKFKLFYKAVFTTQRAIIFGRHCDKSQKKQKITQRKDQIQSYSTQEV